MFGSRAFFHQPLDNTKKRPRAFQPSTVPGASDAPFRYRSSRLVFAARGVDDARHLLDLFFTIAIYRNTFSRHLNPSLQSPAAMDSQSIFQRLQAGEDASEIRFVPESTWFQVGSYSYPSRVITLTVPSLFIHSQSRSIARPLRHFEIRSQEDQEH